MINVRYYGNTPYKVVVVHGGPGAPGEMAPVASELSKKFGVIEPFQSKNTVQGQVEELKLQIMKNTSVPVFLIGWSWGAWLSFILAANYGSLVKKLIIIGSGPFENEYAEKIMQTRLARLTSKERELLEKLLKKKLSAKAGELIMKADSYNLIKHKSELLKFQPEIYESVWQEANKLRKTGELLKFAKDITCPVVAIHGDFDPHPFLGVKKPLSRILRNFRFILLKKCGHHPWYEKEAKEKFYEVLIKELSSN
ncbi:alpha/beta hydrolase [Candidatus Woesebacteria bacterium RBG_16_34_12]|uniref:Alpha/beta hydrolase n=1 Tax=Candidatus Woesebacteria bacterium RBG_16_34_12 TaxID=1802480 RepID=A0A1F7X8Z7_9BACT|nr:MAG: alpha/beta hydrolase [Candidatus Woesebacteria bacterium RBG_16_34_12]